MTRALLGFALVLSTLSPMPVAQAQTVTLNWISWTPPASYPHAATAGDTYDYATTALGELELPGGPTVYVRLTGEIVNPTLRNTGGINPLSGLYGGPSGFKSDNTVVDDYWQNYPVSGSGAAFTSANVPFSQLPTAGDHIGLVGSSAGGNPTQRLEFFEDEDRTIPLPVSNIVMLVGSLGGSDGEATWDFTQDFDILSDNRTFSLSDNRTFFGSGLTRTVKSPGGTGADFQLTGEEGTGAIQFLGSFTELSWTVSAAEIWASWNISTTSAVAPSDAATLPPSEPPAGPMAGSPLTLRCAPDPVSPGAVVSCDVTGGDPGIDILWRTSFGDILLEQQVTLDADGRATFAFRVPVITPSGPIVVELVDWSVSDDVTVDGTAIPTSVRAGEGPAPVRTDWRAVHLLALGLAVVATRYRRLTPR